jgi:phage terminase large subunit
MECSFDAATRGAFYAQEVKQAQDDHRIGDYPADPESLLHFVFDIGRRDDTALGAFQEFPDRVNMVHAEAENMRGPQHWIRRIYEICAQYGCQRGTVWLPHDAWAKTWATERSGVEQFVEAGIKPKRVPSLDKMDGINAARYVFRFVTMNLEPTEQLVLALKSYHRTWDEDKKAFTNEDVHDWSSHYADMFRYFALVARFPHSRPLIIPQVDPMTQRNPTYPFSLDELWELNRGQISTRIS